MHLELSVVTGESFRRFEEFVTRLNDVVGEALRINAIMEAVMAERPRSVNQTFGGEASHAIRVDGAGLVLGAGGQVIGRVGVGSKGPCFKCGRPGSTFCPYLNTQGGYACLKCDPPPGGIRSGGTGGGSGATASDPGKRERDHESALRAEGERSHGELGQSLAYRLFVTDPELVAKLEGNADLWRRCSANSSLMDYEDLERAQRLAWLFNEPAIRARAEERAAALLMDRATPEAPGAWCDRATYHAIESFAARAKAPIVEIVRFANSATTCFPEGDDAAKRAVVCETLAKAEIDRRGAGEWRESPMRALVAHLALKQIMSRVGCIRARGQVDRADAALAAAAVGELGAHGERLEGESFADFGLGLIE